MRFFNLNEGEVMEKLTTLGIDLAKSIFALYGVNGAGRVVLRRSVRREQLAEVIAGLPPWLIGMEACSGAHAWARQFERFGHTVKLMTPTFVVPYRKSGKNDGNDAEAICEAARRPSIRFVPVKPEEQQAVLVLHRVRQGTYRGAHHHDQPHPGAARGIRGGVAQPRRARSLASDNCQLSDIACRGAGISFAR